MNGDVVPDPYWKDMVRFAGVFVQLSCIWQVLGFRHVAPEELKVVGTPLWQEAKTAWFYTTFMIDSTTFLRYMMRQCHSKGITFHQRKVNMDSPISS